MAAGGRVGVHNVSIARFETEARVPTRAALLKVADAHGVDVCDLIRDRPRGKRK